MKKNIFIAGHNGMVGSAIYRILKKDSMNNLITANRKELNLIDQHDVNAFFHKHNIDEVYLAAAKVGGIHANNSYPADFIYENLMIEANIIHSAYKNGVKKLLFLGSSCIYPRNADQPIDESFLLNNKLESTNEPYAIAKIAGIKLCESYNRQFDVDYRSIMPTNLYGYGDNFHSENSHVIPALIKRIYDAKETSKDDVVIWGSGKVYREFLFVDDMAEASIFCMNIDKEKLDKSIDPMCSHINVGSGQDCSIKDLAYLIKDIIGFKGKLKFDVTKPDGTPKKLLNVDKINKLGWSSTTSLKEGITKTIEWYKSNIEHLRKF